MTAGRELLVRRLAEILHKSPEELEADAGRLPQDLDSIILLDLIAVIDELYGVTVSADALTRASSIDAVLNLIAGARQSEPT